MPIQCHWTVHWKLVRFILCVFYHIKQWTLTTTTKNDVVIECITNKLIEGKGQKNKNTWFIQKRQEKPTGRNKLKNNSKIVEINLKLTDNINYEDWIKNKTNKK